MSVSVPNVGIRAHDDTTNTINHPTVNSATPTLGLIPVRRPIGLYRDVGKNVNDLLTKGFPNNFRFELNTSTERGLKFIFATETRTNTPTRESSDSSRKPTEYIFSSAQVKQELKDTGLNFTGTLDSEKLGGEVSLSDLGTKGFKVTFKGNTFDNHKQDATGELEYRNERLAGTLGLFWKDGQTRLDSSLNVAVLDALTVGAQAGYYLPAGSSEGGLDNFAVSGNYQTGRLLDWTSTLSGKRKDRTSDLRLSAGTRLYYTHSLTTTFAVDVNYDLASSYREGVTSRIAVSHKFDDLTSIKARVDNKGNLAGALSQKITTNLTATIGSELNVTNLDNHKLGLHLVFNP